MFPKLIYSILINILCIKIYFIYILIGVTIFISGYNIYSHILINLLNSIFVRFIISFS